MAPNFTQIGKEREKVVGKAGFSGGKDGNINYSNTDEGNLVQSSGNGPAEEDELSGVMFEERKRQRSENLGSF